MTRRDVLQGIGAAMMMSATSGVEAQSIGARSEVVYELRVYHANEGKLELLQLRRWLRFTYVLKRANERALCGRRRNESTKRIAGNWGGDDVVGHERVCGRGWGRRHSRGV